MSADLRGCPSRRIRTVCGAALVVAFFTTAVRAQLPEVPSRYEATARLLIVHKQINQEATPIRVDDAAAAHAAMIASPRIAELAAKKFRLNELPPLDDLPPMDVARTISGATTAVCRPSMEAPNTSVLEIRFRSSGVVDPMAVTKAIYLSYQEFLAAPEEDVEARIAMAEHACDRLSRECTEMKRLGKAIELAEAQRRLFETMVDLPMLRLKARVGQFDVVVVEEPIKAVKLGSR
jgi:hypothetical protein